MPYRQLASVLIALIVIMSAALLIITRGDADDAASIPTSTTLPILETTTTTPTTTAPAISTTTIPTRCTFASATEAEITTTTDRTGADNSEEAGSTSTSTISPTLGPSSSVSTVGLDTVPFGLTVKQAEAAAGTPMIPCSPVSNCYRVTPVDAPDGISFVVHSGTIERVDITDGPITTKSGLGIGTDEGRIVAAFGDQLERVVNDDGSIDLVFVPVDERDADFRVIFTIRDGTVSSFRSGRVPLILATEACA